MHVAVEAPFPRLPDGPHVPQLLLLRLREREVLEHAVRLVVHLYGRRQITHWDATDRKATTGIDVFVSFFEYTRKGSEGGNPQKHEQ